MKINSTIILLFTSLLIIESCSNSNKPKTQFLKFPISIDVNLGKATIDSGNLSDIAKRVEYIPLQTTDSAFLNYFYDYTITRDYFFIRDDIRLLEFDKKGIFRKNLFKNGRGPGETSAGSFAVDDTRKLIYVLDVYKGDIKVYYYDGKYIKTINKPINSSDQRTASIGYFNNSLFVTTIQFPMVRYLFSCFDLIKDSIRIVQNNYYKYDKIQEKKYPSLIYSTNQSFQVCDSVLLFKEWLSDTIFSLNNNLIKAPKYIIGLGNNKLNWEGWRDHGMFNLAGGPPLGYWIDSFVEAKSFIFFVFSSFKEPRLFAIFNKETGSVKVLANKYYDPRANNQIYLKNDLDNIIAFPLMSKTVGTIFYFDNCLYSIIESKDFAKAYTSVSVKSKRATKYLRDMAPVFGKIDEFSNPVIMKVHLK